MLLKKISMINSSENSERNYTNLFNGCISPKLSLRKFIESNPKSLSKMQNNLQVNSNKTLFNTSASNTLNSKNNYYILNTETIEDRLNTEVLPRKQSEKHHSVKTNKVMKTIEDL